MEPGAYMVVPANETLRVGYENEKHPTPALHTEDVTNLNGDWLYWNVRSFMQIEVESWVFSAGYTISNYDVYGGRRNLVIERKPLNDMLWKRDDAFVLPFHRHSVLEIILQLLPLS